LEGRGSTGASWLLTGCSIPCMIDRESFFVESIASVNEVTINKMATPVVNLVKKFPAPPLPNIVWLLPPPNPAPIAAPFPACKSMATIKINAPIT